MRERKEIGILKSIRHFRKNAHMAPFTPRAIQIQTQSVCNGRCVYCPYPEISKKVAQGKMEWTTFVKIADEITQWKDLRFVEFMLQNEPLMDKDLFKIVRYIKSIKPQLKVGIVTNAMFLDKAKAEEMAESGLDEVKISLDSFEKKTYEELHPGFSFDRVLEAIDLVSKLRKNNLSVIISFVMSSKNAAEFRRFVEFVKSKGLRWHAKYLLNRANNVKDYNDVRLTKYSWRHLKLCMLYKFIYRTCSTPFIAMSVLFNGDVIICGQDWGHEIVIGNVKNSSLLDIWDSDMYNGLRQKLADRRYSDVKTCSACTIAEMSS
ncbi:radical SAM/SPASM domain-containing protein [Candidatus Omnitrophota bacterium]